MRLRWSMRVCVSYASICSVYGHNYYDSCTRKYAFENTNDVQENNLIVSNDIAQEQIHSSSSMEVEAPSRKP